jgi:hypothetical protein
VRLQPCGAVFRMKASLPGALFVLGAMSLGACGGFEGTTQGGGSDADAGAADASTEAAKSDASADTGSDTVSRVSFVGSSSRTQLVVALEEFVVPRPPGMVGGDLLVASVALRDRKVADVVATLPEAWTILDTRDSACAASNVGYSVLHAYRFAKDDEPTSLYVAKSSTAVTMDAVVVAYRGVDPLAPIRDFSLVDLRADRSLPPRSQSPCAMLGFFSSLPTAGLPTMTSGCRRPTQNSGLRWGASASLTTKLNWARRRRASPRAPHLPCVALRLWRPCFARRPEGTGTACGHAGSLRTRRQTTTEVR